MKYGRFRKLAFGALFAASTLMATSPALACTQLWIPDAYTADQGTYYFGRSEDYSNRYVKIFGVEEAHPKGFLYYSAESDFKWNAPKATYRYTYVRDHSSEWSDQPNAYSEAGINEKGVSASATLTTSYNAQAKAADPSTDAGIGEYNYVSVILGQSATAREGVELIGSIIDDVGSCGRDQLIISDSTESWLFCVLSGHQWIAMQLPEDAVSVNPNMSNLRYKIDIDDTDTCLYSEGLVSMPENAGFLVKNDDGSINVAETYGTTDDRNNNARYIQGRIFFDATEGLDYEAADGKVTKLLEPTQFFKPGRTDYTTMDGLDFLGYRAEDTVVDANAFGNSSIGSSRTTESHLFQVRRGLDADIATIQWEGLAPGEFNIEIPSYSALLTEVSDRFGDVYMDKAHNSGDALESGDWDELLPYVMMDLNTLGYSNRADIAENLSAYLDCLQAQVIAEQTDVDALMQRTPAGSARIELANKAHAAVSERVWAKCHNVLQEARTYLKGDKAEPFMPSDYDAENDALVEPLEYRSAVVGIDMYRLYNPYSGEHFYTADAEERDDVVDAGWNYEGIGWVAPENGADVYRLYNKFAGEHHYTTDAAERDALIKAGWTDEGVGWKSDANETIPVLRQYNPNEFSNNHNFTTSTDEHNLLTGRFKWKDEGIAWYAMGNGSPVQPKA